MKRQTEWSKQAEKMEQMQRENERLKFEVRCYAKQDQPSQSFYNARGSLYKKDDDIH